MKTKQCRYLLLSEQFHEKEFNAMIAAKGLPQLFITLSMAETRWPRDPIMIASNQIRGNISIDP